jgi:hypothetical protein
MKESLDLSVTYGPVKVPGLAQLREIYGRQIAEKVTEMEVKIAQVDHGDGSNEMLCAFSDNSQYSNYFVTASAMHNLLKNYDLDKAYFGLGSFEGLAFYKQEHDRDRMLLRRRDGTGTFVWTYTPYPAGKTDGAKRANRQILAYRRGWSDAWLLN